MKTGRRTVEDGRRKQETGRSFVGKTDLVKGE